MNCNNDRRLTYVNVYHNTYSDELLQKVANDTHKRVRKILDEYNEKYSQDEKMEHMMKKGFKLYEFSEYIL